MLVEFCETFSLETALYH